MVNRMPRRARSLNFPPRSTWITEPIAREPAGIAMVSPTFTSRVTLASTRSSIFAVSLEIRVSVSRPMTEFADTTISSKTFCGGSGARGDSKTGRSSTGATDTMLSGAAAGELGSEVVCDGDGVFVGHDRSSAGGFWRAVVPADAAGGAGVLRAGSARRDVPAEFVETAAARGEAAAAFGAGSLTIASVSATARSGASACRAVVAGVEAIAEAGVGTVFWRDPK